MAMSTPRSSVWSGADGALRLRPTTASAKYGLGRNVAAAFHDVSPSIVGLVDEEWAREAPMASPGPGAKPSAKVTQV
jgi:hypothetical protein